MLVLTRRVGEQIVIDGDIRITVTAVEGHKVRIGIRAPEYVRVDRKEVSERRAEFADGVRHDLAARLKRLKQRLSPQVTP